MLLDLNSTMNDHQAAYMMACKITSIHQSQTPSSKNEKSMAPITITEEDVYKVLKEINTNKATGPDKISGRIVKQCTTSLLYIIHSIFNVSLDLCHMQNLWKIGENKLILSYQGNVYAMYVLMQAGADRSITDSNGNTALHIVARGSGSKNILQIIINHGADMNAANSENETALLLASRMGSWESVKVLLSGGADVSIADIYGDTCLHKLLHRECDQETLQVLLEHGVPVSY